MKANETRIDKFLATSETTFAIPVYQRNYDWTLTQCRQLFKDIVEVGNDDKQNAHFIGSIVYVHDDVYAATGINELTVIDGQQRLTTITLIYAAVCQLAKQMNNRSLVNRIQKLYLINEFAPEAEKLKLKPTENNKQALQHILNSGVPSDFQGYSRIIENYNYFKNQINAGNYETVLKGLSKLVFVDIALDRTKDNPQRIFESLNSTGLDLSQADLIRNYILMGLKQREQNNIYKNYWAVIEQFAKDETLNISKVSDFIRDYLILINQDIPKKTDVYAKFKSQFPTTDLENLETVLSGLKSLVKFYHKLLNPQKEDDKNIRRQLEYINKLEINVAYPFLMKIYEDYSNSVIDKVTFLAILDLVQSFAWRRFIVGLPTNALNKIFMSLYYKIDKTCYLFSIQKYLLQRQNTQRFPRNSEIINILKEKDVYNIKPKNRTYLLERLENYQNAEPVHFDETITIEHIFPQNPDPKWKIELGNEEYTLIKEKYLNTVGNLTLSGNNGKLGNKTFVEKRDMNIEGKEQGYKFSRMWLNRDLKELEQWNKEEIEKRAETITERFLKIWEFPDIQVELDTQNEEVNIFNAEDPTGKRIEYAIFFGQKIEPQNMADFYVTIMQKLFELQPETFIDTDLSRKLKVCSNEIEYGDLQHAKLSATCFILTNTSSVDKIEKIKEVLTIFDFQDELIIKYKDTL